MTAAGPWSVKGIDPKARELAKDLARRSGMTLGEWLNQVIIEGDADEEANEQLSPRDTFMRPGSRDVRVSGDRRSGDTELRRVSVALDALTARVEASENRSTLAISGIDQHVMGVLARIDGAERDQISIASRFEGQVAQVTDTQGKLTERLRRMGEEDAPRIEAMRALEGALGKIAEKLYDTETRTRAVLNEVREDAANASRRIDRVEAKAEVGPASGLVDEVVARLAERMEQAESRTSAAVRALETSFAGLDTRLKASEEVNSEDGPQRRFERLATELSQKVEANRTELSERLSAAADGKLDRMEGVMRELAGHVEQGERRSAQAIDRMGREVMRIAQTLTERVSSVEARSADAAQQMGGEMARIADAMEGRLAKADGLQAEALEKLGGEIARIAERLADRIASAERRSAQAIDEVGDQLGRAADRLNESNTAANSALTERIQASEERTAKLLDEARENLDRRLAETHRRSTLQGVAEAVRQTTADEPPPAPARQFHSKTALSLDPFSPAEPMVGAGLSAPVDASVDPFGSGVAAAGLAEEPASSFSAPPLAAQDEHYAGFGAASLVAGSLAAEVFDAPPAIDEPDYGTFASLAEPQSTRDVVAAARAAARQASDEAPGVRAKTAKRDALTPLGASVIAPPFEPELADRGRFGFGLSKKKKKESGVTLRTMVVASGTAAALAVTGVGAVIVAGQEGVLGSSPRHIERGATAPTAARAADHPAILASAAAPEPIPGAIDGTGVSIEPANAKPETLAVALAPAPGATIGVHPSETTKTRVTTPAPIPVAPTAANPSSDARPLYNTAVGRLQAGDPSGVADLKRAANLGFAPAQFYLAKLYEAGGSGVKKDLTEARRWTQRAADGGDARAMHNYALFQYAGDGGAQDLPEAAKWFHKAAEQGVVDSQYNLARLYAAGKGVPKNPAEAYKWYLIAAGQGDADSRAAADALKGELPPETQAVAERSAAAFRAQKAGSVQTAAARP